MEIQENKTTNRKIMFVNGFYTMIANPKFWGSIPP
jgi:hypothetical protein